MKIKSIPFYLIMLFFSAKSFAQVPYEWPIINSNLTPKLTSINHKVDSLWKLQGSPGYCTNFAGNLQAANGNVGYKLFTPAPPGPFDSVYENQVLEKVDTMLIAMDSLGYKALEITIPYPLLCDSFPNNKIYLDFFKKVYAMARSMGFKIIDHNTTVMLSNSGTDTILSNDAKKYYSTPAPLNTSRYLYSITKMRQTVIDSLTPDYLTLEVEPETQQANLENLITFTPTSALSMLNYFLANLKHKGNILFGAGGGTWNTLNYYENYAATSVDYLDYHIFVANGTEFNPEVFQIDSIAKVNGKRLVIGECSLHKESDSEYVAHPYPGNPYFNAVGDREVFDYFEGIDTLFQQALINLSQQADIDLVNFFPVYDEFGYLTWQNSYVGVSDNILSSKGLRLQRNNLDNMAFGPLGIFTKKAIAKINCSLTDVNNMQRSSDEINIYPNPVSSQLSISFNQPVQNIKIENTLGQTILDIKINSSDLSTQTIDVRNFPNGIYFIKIKSSSDYIVRKFIKN